MIQESPAGSINLRGQPETKSHSRVSGILMVSVLLILVLLDIISPPGPPISALIGGIVYGGKTAIGAIVVLLGLTILPVTKTPLIFRASVILYTIIVIAWFIFWLFGERNINALNSSFITYLLNPTHSIWSWLFILLVPVVVRWNTNGQLSNAITKIPLFVGLVIMVVPALGMGLLNWNLNASNAGVMMLFLLACRSASRRIVRMKHFILALVVAGAMLVADYRIYGAAALLFATNIYLPKTRKVLIPQMMVIASLPLIYYFAIDNYADFFVSKDNPFLYDTRSFLFNELLYDFSNHELWIGRGIDGNYFSPYFLYVAKHMGTSVGYNNIWRTTSEIGWLNVILHYGLQSLIPFIIAIFTPAFVNPRRCLNMLPVHGIYCFLPAMTLLFAGELWNAISTSYFCWFVALGVLLTNGQSAGQRAGRELNGWQLKEY